jgi:hypothetical protein
VCMVSTHCINCWKPVTPYCVLTQYKLSALLCAKMEAASPPKLDLSPGGLGRGQLTAILQRGGGALKPSVASIPLFPGFPDLRGPGEATPPRGDSVVSAEAKTRLPAIPCNPVALLIG